MPVFEYQARTKEGHVQIGRVQASDKDGALEILHRNNLVVIAIELLEGGPKLFSDIRLFERVNKKDLSIFSRQLATLFEASVPLVISLHAMAKQIENRKLQEAVLAIAANVDGGMRFSDALDQHQDIFSNFYIQLVRAGEESGTLDDVLSYLAEYTEREYSIVSKTRGAMIYPAFVMGIFLIVGVAMLVFVIPQLTNVIERGGAELPALTKFIMGLSDLLRTRWHILIGALGAAGFGFAWWIRTPAGQDFWSRLQLKLPVFSTLFQNIYTFRFSASLAMLVKGGVPINKSLGITAKVIDNTVFREIIERARDQVSKGETISDTLEPYSDQIPATVVQMIRIGERTGKLDSILDKVSGFYEDEVNNTIDNLVSLIEPVLIVVMGIGVALLMAGVLLPVYSSINTIGG